MTSSRIMNLVCLWPILVGMTGCWENEPNSDSPFDDGPREGYPTGSYGVDEDSVIENLEFVLPDGGVFTLRDIYADGVNHVLLINTAAGWCTACIEEMPALQEIADGYSGKGLAVVVAVFEDEDFQPATAAYAEHWQDRYDLNFTVVADPTFSLSAYYDTAQTPMNMIIEVPTMKIVRITTGFDRPLIEGIIRALVPSTASEK